jgi:hypothetical protein
MESVLLISDLSATIQMSCEWIIEFCWYDITLFVKLFLEFFYKKWIFNGKGMRFTDR